MKIFKFPFMEAAQGDAAAGGSEAATNGAASQNDQRTIEDRALEMGWVPQNEFRGKPELFIPAEEFVKRGENVLPIIKANIRRVESKFDDQVRQNRVLQSQIDELAAENEELKKGQTKSSVEGLKAKRSELADELKIVREAGNTQREVELLGEINQVNAEILEGEKAVTAPAKQRQPDPHIAARENPDYKAFVDSHPWYGTDKRRTYVANAIGEEIKAANPNLKGKAFFDKVSEEIEKTMGGNQRRQGSSRVEGGVRGTSEGGGTSANGKTVADLPLEARQAMQSQATRLVGPGKRFKDMSSWQTYYVSKYFE